MKPMGANECKKTEFYQDWKDGCYPDMPPATYNGNVYCSSRKLIRRLNNDFKQIRENMRKALRKIDVISHVIDLEFLIINKEVAHIWLYVDGMPIIIVWVKDKVDLRLEKDNEMMSNDLLTLYQERLCNEKD